MSSSPPSGAGARRGSPSEPCLVDTDVVSFLFRGDTRAAFYRDYLIGRQPGVSFQTLAELRRWALIRRWGTSRRRALARLLAPYTTYLVDEAMIDAWAMITHRVQSQGRHIATGDAWIAATAWVQRIPLVTHNRRDFSVVDGLTIISADAVEGT